MPKLLRKKLWKRMTEMVVLAVVMALAWVVADQIFGSGKNGLYYTTAVMCNPFVHFVYSNHPLVMNDYVYIAPYSYEQRKNIFKKYFYWQFLWGCVFTTAWNILFFSIIMETGGAIHPVKAIFVLIIQFCLLYEMIYVEYYRSRLLFVVVVFVSLIIGVGIMTAVLKNPKMSLADYIGMTVLGVICAGSVIALRLKYFERMIDCHSKYETSRNAIRGL